MPASIHQYSLYVSWMKTILPVGILLALGFSFGWPYILSLQKGDIVPLDPASPEIKENRMIHPHYISVDNKGQPYHVDAEWAKQRTDTLADLTNPHGTLTSTDGPSFNVTAKTGLYDLQGKVLNLEGGVTLTSTDGYNVKTEKALVTFNNKVIEGNSYIEGEGPKGSLKGEKGFKVENCEGGKVLTLKGRSRVIIEKTAFQKDSKPHAE